MQAQAQVLKTALNDSNKHFLCLSTHIHLRRAQSKRGCGLRRCANRDHILSYTSTEIYQFKRLNQMHNSQLLTEHHEALLSTDVEALRAASSFAAFAPKFDVSSVPLLARPTLLQ